MASPLIVPIFRAFSDDGLPLAGGKLYSYVAGTSTPQATYTDSTLLVANANPTILDAEGYANVWLGTASYKFVLKDADDVTLWTEDNINQSGVPSAASAASEWTVFGGSPTFISSTQFSVTGDQTATFTVGRRLKSTNTAGTVYSIITASAFGSVTTVTVTNTSGVLDSGLSAVYYAFEDAPHWSTPVPSAVFAESVANQTGIGTAATTVVFGTESVDLLGEFAASTFTPTYAGWYRIAAIVTLGTGTAVAANVFFTRNGSALGAAKAPFFSSTEQVVVPNEVICLLAAGDAILTRVQFGSGAANAILTGSSFTAQRLA